VPIAELAPGRIIVANERLRGSDRLALLLWLVAAVAGGLFAFKYFFAAFPEAAVNFQVPRAEAVARARQFVTDLGENVSGYQSSIVFSVADGKEERYAKTYLERELGLEQANRLMAGELSIWYWEVRFFRPLQKEEFRLHVSTAGKITGYEHIIEEARAGGKLERAAAETSARQFLTTRYGAALENWEFLSVEANSTQRPKRLDWSFTWEKRGFRAKDAPYRMRVTLQGDRIGSVEEYLQVPEAWQRGFQKLRSSNEFYGLVAIVPYLLLFGSAIWLAISLTRCGQTRWGGAIKLGLVVAVLLFLMQVNEWPLLRAGYDTKDSYGSFIAMRIVGAILFAVLSALTVALILPAAEPLYRVTQPGRLRLSAALTLRGLRTKEFFNSAFVGLCLAAAHIGFVVAFYLYGRRFGVWAPQELNYSDTINTAFPWISGVAIGLLAATSEEFLFRLFAIPFLERLTKSRWIAVILPAFAWSFLHSTYPQEPGYIRGIEVGIIGIVAGLVMLRWGILATLIWHYTVDALLIGLLLIRSDSLYFKLSGVVVGAAAVAPLAFAGVSYLLRRGFEADETLLNRAEPLPDVRLVSPVTAETAAVSTKRYDALSRSTIGILVGLLLVCLAVGALFSWKVKPESLGDYVKLKINARDARRIGNEALQARGVKPETYRTATTFVSVMDSYTNEYLRESLGIKGANSVYESKVPGELWRVRYFRDSQVEEYAVILRPDGSLHSVRHTLAENAPGASLDKEQAIAAAESFLREKKKLDLQEWHLVESNSDKKPHRIDHTLTWEEIVPLAAPLGPARFPAGPAYARFEVQVLGDEVTNYRTFVKIPEEWRRRQEEFSLPRTLYQIGSGVFFGGLALMALILYLVRLRSQPSGVPWKVLAKWGAVGTGAFLLNVALGTFMQNLLANYRTEIPFRYMTGIGAISVLIRGAFQFGSITLLFGLAWAYGSRAFGEDRLPAKGRLPGSYYRDALWIGFGGTSAFLAVVWLTEKALSHWPTLQRSLGAGVDSNFYATLPAVAAISDAVTLGLFMTGLIALAASFIAAEFRRSWLRVLLFVLAAFFMVWSWGNSADFAKQFVERGVMLGVIVLGVSRLVRFNLLGYFLIVAGSALLVDGVRLLSQPNSFYRENGFAVLFALMLLLAWPLIKWRLHTDSTEVGVIQGVSQQG
jgi:membrane protease YdiL (CAAX protease family)